MPNQVYSPSDFGKKEEELMRIFNLQLEDARRYFEQIIKPRLDRSYKLYVNYTGDRQKEIQEWQANVFVPYIHAVVETLLPRILDARPEFTAQGRTEADQPKCLKQQQLIDYDWEISKMDTTAELVTKASLIYGMGYMQASWKKDVRTHKFLTTKDLLEKKYKYEDREQVFYDAPFAEWVDNYSLWYDWHNVAKEDKQFWFKRLCLTGASIKRRYPNADPKRLKLALAAPGGDLTDYASIRNDVKSAHDKVFKGANTSNSSTGMSTDVYQHNDDPRLNMYEVFEWTRPFDDAYGVHVGASNVPILKGGSIPMIYDFKEAPFIPIPYLLMPNEFEGWGIPMLLENPQMMLNMVKNQRLDSVTLSIHKMWIVNPLANVNKDQLVVRPFGIIYSVDPKGVQEIQFSDIKASAYKEEELMKGDMRYASGVDDSSMGVGANGGTSATEVRHLRESTLERVRLFVNHLGAGFSDLMRYWLDMHRQFFTGDMEIRVIGENGAVEFPLIEQDDLMGRFDYRASVLPSIAGQNDVKKKQDMDLFQLLINLPFVEPRKLTSKLLHDWNWSLDAIAKAEEEQQMPPEGMPPEGGEMSPEMMAMMQQQAGGEAPGGEVGLEPPALNGKQIPPEVLKGALSMLRKGGESPHAAMAGKNAFAEAGMPINLLASGAAPPTAKGISLPTSNPRGMNRGGKVNTNVAMKPGPSEDSKLANRALNIQK